MIFPNNLNTYFQSMATFHQITSNFQNLDKFEGVESHYWHKKMHFLLTSLKVVCISNTFYLIELENKTCEQARHSSKLENDDYICRGHILNSMSDVLFNVYQSMEIAKELWEALENKYMMEDASSKNFLGSQLSNDKMVKEHSVLS